MRLKKKKKKKRKKAKAKMRTEIFLNSPGRERHQCYQIVRAGQHV